VVSADLGEFGPTDGKPALYHFSPLYHVQGLIPWLLLPLAFVALKENRTAQAAWILVPIALLATVYSIIMNLLRMTSGSLAQLNVMFTIMIVGFAMIWLLAERIGNRNRFITFLLATLVYFGFLGVALLSHGFAKDVVSISLLAALSIPPIVFAFIMAALGSSRPFRRARFIACIGATLFGSILIIASAIAFILQPSPDRSIDSQIAGVLLASFFISLAYFVGLLPFLVLQLANSFWRKRFECVMGIGTSIR